MTGADILERLAQVLETRKQADPDESYVAGLYAKGPDAVLKKIAEEAAETIMAVKDGDPKQIVHETTDLWFHCLVMLAQQNLSPVSVLAELENRYGLSGIAEKAKRANA